MTKRHTAVDAYYAEQFDYGGVLLTRKEVIDRLTALGGTQKQIDAYLFGADLAKRIAEKRTERPA